jgi:transcriptional regulator GlxA family with amidase domain
MQRIGFAASPDFQVLSFAASSAFEYADGEMGEPVYDVRLLSETGGPVRTSMGIGVATEPFNDANFDTLIVCRGAEPTPRVIEFLRQAPGRCRRVAPLHSVDATWTPGNDWKGALRLFLMRALNGS